MGASPALPLARSRGIPTLRPVAAQSLSALRVAAVLVWATVRWTYRHLRWVVCVAGVAFALRLFPGGQPVAIRLLVLGWLVPAVVAATWARWSPGSFQRVVAGPSSRASWR